MAPIVSLLRDMAERQDSRPVTYFYGARTLRDLFLLSELHGFAQRLANFRFIPALSEPQTDDAWKGEADTQSRGAAGRLLGTTGDVLSVPT